MKKIISLIVVLAIVAGLFFAIQSGSCCKLSPVKELAQLSGGVPQSPALYMGLRAEPALLQQLQDNPEWNSLRKALRDSKVVRGKINKAIDSLPEEPRAFVRALVNEGAPVSSMERLMIDNFVAGVVYVKDFNTDEGYEPEVLAALTLQDPAKLVSAMKTVKELTPATVLGKEGFTYKKLLICVDGQRILLSNSQSALEAFFTAVENGKQGPCVLDNPRFQKLAGADADSLFVAFADAGAFAFGQSEKSKKSKAEFDEVDKMWGISAVKAVGVFSRSDSLSESRTSFRALFEGESLLYQILSIAKLEPGTLLAQALPKADYALSLAVPTLSEEMLKKIGAAIGNPSEYYTQINQPEFQAINGNLSHIAVSVSDISVTGKGMPNVLAVAKFKNGAKLFALPKLKGIFAMPGNPFLTDIDGAKVFITPGISFALIQLNANELAVSTSPDAQGTVALLQGKAPTLAANPEAAAACAKLGAGNLIESYQDYKSVMKLYASMFAMEKDPKMQWMADYFGFLNTVINSGNNVMGVKVADGILAADAFYHVQFDYKAAAEKIRALK